MKQTFLILLLLNLALLFVVLGSNASSDTELAVLPAAQLPAAQKPVVQKPVVQEPATTEVVARQTGAARPGAQENEPRREPSTADSAVGTGNKQTKTAALSVIGLPSRRTTATRSATTEQKSCSIAGPFRDESQADRFVGRLGEKGIDSVRAPRNSKILPDYMVYIGPADDVSAARVLEKEIRALEMDVHLIATGRLRNALSLGVFSRLSLADVMVAESVELGYQALIEPIGGKRRGFQVQADLPAAVRQELRAADVQIVDCPQAIAQR